MQDISDATLDALDSGAELRDQFAAAEHKFRALAADTHLPFLEVRVYSKYLLQAKTERSLANLHHVIGVLSQHRTHTLRVLKTVHERENVLVALFAKADEYSGDKVSTLDAQSQVLRLLYCHQQATLKVAEAIEAWRALLTRPFPFNWKGGNYMAKIIADAQHIDGCALRSILPLRLSQFPLCSNIASLALFAADPAAAALRPGQKPKEASPQEVARLRNAEGLLFEEATLQEKLHRELEGAAAAGYFIPLLNVQAVIPNCCTGIRVSNKQWGDKLTRAIADSRDGKAPAPAAAAVHLDGGRSSSASRASSPPSRGRSPSASSSKSSGSNASAKSSKASTASSKASGGGSGASSRAASKSGASSPARSASRASSPAGDKRPGSAAKSYASDDFGSSSGDD